MTTTTTRRLSCAETAKLVRQALKREFPGVKFSVRSHTYSGGASIHVSWTDGPRADRVDRVLAMFEGAAFDGMIDLKYNKEHWIRPDGSVLLRHTPGTYGNGGLDPAVDNRDLEAVIPDDAERVSFGADFVFSRREISNRPAKLAAAREWLCEYHGIPQDAMRLPGDSDSVSFLLERMVEQAEQGDSWLDVYRRLRHH